MLVTFILGIAAAWGAAFVEDHLRGHLARALSIEPGAFQAVEMRVVSLAICLFVAAILAWIVADAHAVALTLGAVIGVLIPRLKDRLRAARAPDYDA